ncbi:MAG: LysM peptidoglycan-binding domain-containing protein [Spartobacteria bacterium]
MKFKFPTFKQTRKRKKLRATAVRHPMRAATTAEYGEMSEPNMKLSRALLIVLILHVVAVSGIIAFNAIKTRQAPVPTRVTAAPIAAPIPKAEPAGAQIETFPKAHAVAKTGAKAPDDSHKSYTVAKGDNPVTIAKKLKVPYDDLLALNHIDDPRKLKIGQKLLIPNKAPKAKKAE